MMKHLENKATGGDPPKKPPTQRTTKPAPKKK
jgi:hypothetical protein